MLRFPGCSCVPAVFAGLALACFDPPPSNYSSDDETGDGGETGVGAETGEADGGSGSCGNGELDEGEQCDEGENNSDEGLCKTDCTPQSCGDGFVGPGELCDDGNTEDGDGCTASCIPASCGDGVADPDEECDDGNSDDTDACTSACRLPACGDGFLQGDEQCDDGNTTPDDACTSECKPAVCGDGFVFEGEEECDDGNESNTDDCLDTCLAASCGDGYINVDEEECEPADDQACSIGCMLNYRYVFVSSSLHDGDFGGLVGADVVCQEDAEAEGLPGVYYAWLSTEESSPATRFTKSEVPYVLVDQTPVALDWDDLTDGSLISGIKLRPDGSETNSNRIWTGTTAAGHLSGNKHCFNWALAQSTATAGVPGSNTPAWTSFDDGYACSLTSYAIYCFRQ